MSTSSEGYQKWAQHPTQRVKRWLIEERLFSDDWVERAQDWDLDVLEQALCHDLSRELSKQAALSAIHKDLLEWALQQVDWRDIAESLKLATQGTDSEDEVSDSEDEDEEIEIEGKKIEGEAIEGEDIGGEDIEGEDIEGEDIEGEECEDELTEDEVDKDKADEDDRY